MVDTRMASTPIILVARNGLPLTKRAIRSAQAQDVPVEILVVDNASTDGTINWLQTKKITTIFTLQQWALAKCWNVALEALWKVGHKAALVINSDVELRSDTVRQLLRHGGEFVTAVSVNQPEQVGIPSPMMPDWVDPLINNSGLPLWDDRPRPDFSCFLIRKSVTDKVGWFDEKFYPAWHEDNDMHVRMHRAGIKAVCIDLPFLHLGAATMKRAEGREKDRLHRGFLASRERFRQKYGCISGTPEYEALFEQLPKVI